MLHPPSLIDDQEGGSSLNAKVRKGDMPDPIHWNVLSPEEGVAFAAAFPTESKHWNLPLASFSAEG